MIMRVNNLLLEAADKEQKLLQILNSTISLYISNKSWRYDVKYKIPIIDKKKQRNANV